jgi:hypothetical protein
MATQTKSVQQSSSAASLSPGVLSVILDTGSITNQEACKTLVMGLFATDSEQVTPYLITGEGQAWKITPDNFEETWNNLSFGGGTDISPGFEAVQKMAGVYQKDTAFRVIFLTERQPSGPIEANYNHLARAISNGRMIVGVLGEGPIQEEAYGTWRTIVGSNGHVTMLNYDTPPSENATLLYRNLEPS